MMVKIVLISQMLQHYRLTFYEKLSKCNNNYQLIIVHGVKKKEDGRPGYIGSTRFINYGFRTLKIKIFPFEIAYDWGMYSAVRKINPDIIILHGIAGNIAYRRIISWAKKNRKKIIIWSCGWDSGKAKGFLRKFKNRLVVSFLKKGNYFLTYSSNASKYIESMGIENKYIETCYNSIETDDLIRDSEGTIKKSKEIIRKYNLENTITFLYVGGLVADKRVDLLINAFTELRKTYDKIKLIIIGDGPEKKKVVDKLNKINDSSIIYLGRIINDVDSYFVAADCFVLPGIGGLALNQAMFWRKPCIVSKADGTEDDLVIEDYSGYRFKEGDLISLVSAMDKRINENPNKLGLLSENAYQIILNKSNVNNMVRIFSNTINSIAELEKQDEHLM